MFGLMRRGKLQKYIDTAVNNLLSEATEMSSGLHIKHPHDVAYLHHSWDRLQVFPDLR